MENIDKFVDLDLISDADKVTYWYRGTCPQTGKNLRLPRTILAEKVALSLADQLTQQRFTSPKGKMLGILIVRNDQGKLGVIKAFSGFLQGKRELAGWVSPIPGYSVIAIAEKLTIAQLEKIKQQILQQQNLLLSPKQEYQQLSSQAETEKQELKKIHQRRKQVRHQQRQQLKENFTGEILTNQLAKLEQQSRNDDWERRKLKRQWQTKLQPLIINIQQTEQKIRELKTHRKKLSRQLQAQMQTAFTLTNFAGDSLSVGEVMGKTFIPTGTGDCCTPKLLHHAVSHNLQPIAMAELWWGDSTPNGEKIAGQFYPACVERCQPLMGFLLSGLPQVNYAQMRDECLEIIYEDEYLLAVNKPDGLLSISGRGSEKFDSVVTRLQTVKPELTNIVTVHRLDQDTSGILILAKDKASHVNIARQFEQRQVKKIYEAVLAGIVKQPKGIINLPIYSNPEIRPRQEINLHRGKPSITLFQVLNIVDNQTRIEFKPVTGRTHQLRLHSAHPLGLNVAIKGDRLYGETLNKTARLYLHAREVSFNHPQSGKMIKLTTETPF